MKNIGILQFCKGAKAQCTLLTSLPCPDKDENQQAKTSVLISGIYSCRWSSIDPAISTELMNLGLNIYQIYDITGTSPIIAVRSRR